MFDRLQKPFLTVETGEAYQPIRLTYTLLQPEKLSQTLEGLQCIEKNPTPNSWSWYWKAECDELHFESINSYQRIPNRPLRLATVTLRNGKVFINLTSFKRACMAVPFFYKVFDKEVLSIHVADFINKVFSLDERLPHGFAELFKDDELDRILQQRVEDYYKVKEKVELAPSAEEALNLLSQYTQVEAKKRLPYAERYLFDLREDDDPDVLFLAFYIYLRGRELVAIRRWFGQVGVVSESTEDTLAQVFGEMGIDILE
ncbi:MAG: hypothetical protein K0S27_765 [Gammaproteobacteria bacterium]|jgi:hypothetical protein|nr:hypothetical protein [Gammaproteobacteria bacterium]